MIVKEDDDNILHSLPKPKYTLNYSVERNIPYAKNTNKFLKITRQFLR